MTPVLPCRNRWLKKQSNEIRSFELRLSIPSSKSRSSGETPRGILNSIYIQNIYIINHCVLRFLNVFNNYSKSTNASVPMLMFIPIYICICICICIIKHKIIIMLFLEKVSHKIRETRQAFCQITNIHMFVNKCIFSEPQCCQLFSNFYYYWIKSNMRIVILINVVCRTKRTSFLVQIQK